MLREIHSKTILRKTKRRDPWFLDDYTINPYSGCSFNCLYCYIRGSKYGYNLAEKLSAKSNALEILEKELAAKAQKQAYGIIVLSSVTDPYLQFEKDYGLTRNILELILRYQFPVHIITKSDLVIRDFDLLEKIDRNAILPLDLQEKLKHKAIITFSFSSVHEKFREQFEPGATPIAARLSALQQAASRNFHTGVSLMPLLPGISDTEEILENMYREFSAAGAKYIIPAPVTLYGNEPSDNRILIYKAVEKNYPELLENYRQWFDQSAGVPDAYKKSLREKIRKMILKYQIGTQIAQI